MKIRQDDYGEIRLHKTDKDHFVRGCTLNERRRCERSIEIEQAARRPLRITRRNEDLLPTQLAYIRKLRIIAS